jgi:diguanylate cyclase (GGDEF)-like protein/PAS domain S-box-containing protein
MYYQGLEIPASKLLESAIDSLSIGVWIMDREGKILHGNPAGQRIWGGARFVKPDQFSEYKGWWRATGKRIEAHEWAAARAVTRGETSIDEEIEIECFDGSRKIILNSAFPIRNDEGRVVAGVIVNVDITARVRLEERLRAMAETDSLTGVYARGRFYELLHHEMALAVRYERTFSLIMCDVDLFKQINDKHGHGFGDKVLVFLTDLVRGQIREHEYVARIGGDEFVILLPETKNKDAVVLAERIQRQVATDQFAQAHGISCSFGVCEYVAGESADDLLARVDRALYQAKAAGRRRVGIQCA